MIQFEKTYDINDGNGSVTFKKVDDLTVEAVYNRGTIKGTWDGETLKGSFIDNVSNGNGLIHFTFNDNGFEAKWKSGLEEGPLKGKWSGKLLVGNTEGELAKPSDKITITVVVENFNYRAKRSLILTAEELGIVGKSYASDNNDLQIRWGRIETVDDYRYSLDENFYDHMYDSGYEIKSGNEFGDWYEYEVIVENEQGEVIYSGKARG